MVGKTDLRVPLLDCHDKCPQGPLSRSGFPSSTTPVSPLGPETASVSVPTPEISRVSDVFPGGTTTLNWRTPPSRRDLKETGKKSVVSDICQRRGPGLYWSETGVPNKIIFIKNF